MAATPFDPSLPNNPLLFDIYNDAAFPAARSSPAPGNFATAGLPAGACGFVDLTPGASGTRCGCRRFWSRPSNQARAFPELSSPDQTVWCMCSHHACYHEDVKAMAPPPVVAAVPATTPAASAAPGQENERPKGNREPLTPVQDLLPFQMPSALGISMDVPGFAFAGPSFATNLTEGGPPPSRAHGGSVPPTQAGPDASLPDTLSWVNEVQSQHGGSHLPPIPSQCLLPQSPSTTASSHIRYLKPFAGKGLNTLKGKGIARPNESLVCRDADGPSQSGSLDHATLPNTQASPQDALPLLTAPTPTCALSQDFDTRPPGSAAGSHRDALRNLTDAVQGHEQRIDRLENTSFSVAGHEDCSDKHDQTDLRVTELESRVDEVEKRLNDDNSTIVSSHRRDDATASVISGGSIMASDAELYAKLQALQAQVNQLQASSLPTYNSPWELEVVILPFPLKGVWMLPHEFQSQSQRTSGAGVGSAWDTNGDEWTQLPNTHSRQTPDPISPHPAGDWPGQSPGSTWLLPRACAPGRIIDERLRSRGLIKTLSVKGADARSVHLAVTAAFGAGLRALGAGTAAAINNRTSPLAHAMFEKFLGLSVPWVPLRKLHKDSRLRFLSPAEMLTPTLWDVNFLMSSVVMKATGMHRLYVTQPEAYVQDHFAREHVWTWQRVRELNRVCADSQSSSENTIEQSPNEGCWRWTDRLDQVPPAVSPVLSVAKEHAVASRSRSSAATSSSQVFYSAQSPGAIRGKSPALLRDRRASRPPHIRTASMPIPVHAASSPGGQHHGGKSRVASATGTLAKPSPFAERRASPFEPRRASPFTGRPSPRIQMAQAVASVAAVQKRRATRSPSVRLRNTPRWSTARSMSRSPSVVPRGVSAAPPSALAGGSGAARGTTPFCYATPYSTAPMELSRGAERCSVGPPHSSGFRGVDDDEDDEDMDYDDNDGCTDPYDDDHDMMSRGYHEEVFEEEDDDEEDEDGDIDVYEDEPERQALDESSGPAGQMFLQPEDEPWPGIEDNMSDGENMDPMMSPSASAAEDEDDVAIDLHIGDADHRGGGGVGPAAGFYNGSTAAAHDEDAASDVSSQPSEYPSTQRAWHITATAAAVANDKNVFGGVGFRIHED